MINLCEEKRESIRNGNLTIQTLAVGIETIVSKWYSEGRIDLRAFEMVKAGLVDIARQSQRFHDCATLSLSNAQLEATKTELEREVDLLTG